MTLDIGDLVEMRGETAAGEPREWAKSPNFRVASKHLGVLPSAGTQARTQLPASTWLVPRAQCSAAPREGGEGESTGWTSSANFRVACRRLEHGASSANFRVACRRLEHGASSQGVPGSGCLDIVQLSRACADAATFPPDLPSANGWKGNDAFRTAARCVYDLA